jgi:hypothetical protein
MAAAVSRNPEAARLPKRHSLTGRRPHTSFTGAPLSRLEFFESDSKKVGIRAIYPVDSNIILTPFIISGPVLCPEAGI